jgi:methanogenic corrinoid protein MtbC1
MASMNRYEGHSSAGDGCIVERGFPPDALNIDAFRVHLDIDYERSLSRLIEGEIIPRLMVAHSGDSAQIAPVVSGTIITIDEVEAFTPLVMQVEADMLMHHVEAILARGIPFESVLVDLLAPAARMLGVYWETDRCDFVDVTMGLWRLQEVVHEMSGRLRAEHQSTPGSRRALFSPMPGDQHSFGTIMIDDIFRREGWMTERLTEPETADLLHLAENDWYDIIGLTVSCDCHIAHLRSTIAALRSVSKNPHVCVMVGGRIFSADPDLAVHVGADGTAGDAKSAPRVADELVRERERAVAP